jgi:hypothetical protein
LKIKFLLLGQILVLFRNNLYLATQFIGDASQGKIIVAEGKQQGAVMWRVYLKFAKYLGIFMALIFLLLGIGESGTLTVSLWYVRGEEGGSPALVLFFSTYDFEFMEQNHPRAASIRLVNKRTGNKSWGFSSNWRAETIFYFFIFIFLYNTLLGLSVFWMVGLFVWESYIFIFFHTGGYQNGRIPRRALTPIII